MRWRWWRTEPEPGDPAGWPGPPARLPDPTYRPEPAEHGGAWMDLLPDGYPMASDDQVSRDPLTAPTELVRVITPGQRMRGWCGGWR